MTSYSDLPKINQLYGEQQQILSAIELVDGNGILSNFTIAPRPDDSNQTVNPAGLILPKAPVPIIVTTEISNDLRLALREWLTQRLSDLTMELADLGVTGNPTP